MQTRRELLGTAAASGALMMSGVPAFAQAAAPVKREWLGGAMGQAGSGIPARRQPAPQPGQPRTRRSTVDLIDYVHGLGAAGLELGTVPEAELAAVKARLEALNMFVILQAAVPATPDGDLAPLENSLKQAQFLGARTMRAAMGGRRYEDYKSVAEWEVWRAQKDGVVEKVAPLFDRYKIAMAIENHKDRTGEQEAALLKRISSEYVGSLVDFGNSLSLCETTDETLRLVGPYVKACHVKDMGVEPYADGFLLSEVTMGTGIIDLKNVVATLRRTNPNLLLMQESIIRDPLKIPIKTDLYWATFPERRATHQAKMEAFVAAHKSKTPLPILSAMTPDQQFAKSESDVKTGFSWIRANIT